MVLSGRTLISSLLFGSGVDLAVCSAEENLSVANCSASFLTPAIDLPYNAQVLDVSAALANSQLSDTTLNLCNVTVTYTHPSWNDTIHITIYLPETGWNGRFQGVGGGGWATSSGSSSLLSPVAAGYSAGSTDGGHENNFLSTAGWAEQTNGQLNMPLFTDFASVSLNDLAVVGKQITNRYYGYGPNYSYWNGCSTGGRQGLMMAQKYPTAYNGIHAAAPAINWPVFLVAEYWGQFLMNQLDRFPPQCVFDAITDAAVKACEFMDDGFIAQPGQCLYDPFLMVGKSADCNGTLVNITSDDATIVQKIWEGPRTADGTPLWWGLNPGTPFDGLIDTECTGSAINCTGNSFGIATDWISRWILEEPDYDFQSLTLDEFVGIFYQALIKYNAIIGTNNIDLRPFHHAGGKMVTWHGLADPLIFPGGTIDYYRKAMAFDPEIHKYYRFFPAPGVGHCGEGNGAVPSDPLTAVVEWVEQDTAPDVLPAVTTDGTISRNLCMYPLASFYTGGDPTDAGSFVCKFVGDYIDNIISYADFVLNSNGSSILV